MSKTIFFGTQNTELIEVSIADTEVPDGVSIRLIAFGTDLPIISNLPMEVFVDTVNPAYGMVAEDCSDELTLVATRDGNVIGQISASFEVMGSSQTNLDLWVSGVFVADGERKYGIATALGEAMTRAAENWRRHVAQTQGRNWLGEVGVSGDANPGSGGEAVVNGMEGLAAALSDEAYSDCPVLNTEAPSQ
jgi:hypothetical protein